MPTKPHPDLWGEFLHTVKERGLFDEFSRICRENAVTLSAAYSHRKTAALVHARCQLWVFLREAKHFSYPEIGALFQRHHTTILEGVRRAAGRPPKSKLRPLAKKDREP